MGVLVHDSTDSAFTLQARTVIGRSAVCHVRLSDPRISGEHATISWTGRGWTLRDLGSSNGTFVDGRALDPGVEAPLTAERRLSFGHADAGWRLLDASGPVATALEVAGPGQASAEGDLLCLPTPLDPTVAVFLDAEGHWVAEGPDGPEPVGDQALVRVDGALWRLHLPSPLLPTLRGGSESGLQLFFRVSSDEEYVELDAVQDGERIELGAATFNYLLLVLARERLSDGEHAEAERGWVHQEDLSRMLGLHDTTVYTQIHRARHRLAKAGVAHAGSVVERRKRTRQLRIGTGALQVTRI